MSKEPQERFLPSDVEEAAKAGATQYYIANGYSPFPHIECDAYKNGFIAGAEWQKKRKPTTTDITGRKIVFCQGLGDTSEGRIYLMDDEGNWVDK